MAKKKILIIDDEEDICTIMKLNLESTGEFDVSTSSSPRIGVEMAKASDFDVIITDFNMPDMTGGEVLSAIKEAKPESVILLFSVFHDDDFTIDRSIREMADGLIAKPVEHSQLYDTIKSALAKSNARKRS